ncbi:hypothetical protein H312_03470 [Anncaliia algerae PRA339]|uniref:DNA recombination and repair protein Rad51-like C-terminal domain-containing protein n=1 Tax=Anncaliia algerae PRA339 TaxID=1288291 RepID=A0A059EWN3_9MICR|nr:hypothetical protein H312_03470 [Anncaliia algerae PRA339]
MQFHGLTELSGEPGIGKTRLSLFFSRDYNTLYICTKNVKLPFLDTTKRFLIMPTYYLRELIFLIKYKIKDIIDKENINLIILDSLDHLLCYEKINQSLYKKIKDMIYVFKGLIYNYNIRIIFINNIYENKGIGWIHKVLGMNFFYFLNTRIVLIKICNEVFVKKTFPVDKKEKRNLVTKNDQTFLFY